MHNTTVNQKLFWSVGAPFRYLGFTVDELCLILGGFGGCVVLLNTGYFLVGLGVLLCTIVSLTVVRNFKKMSKHFLLKSYLLAKGFMPPPSSNYPHLLGERVYR